MVSISSGVILLWSFAPFSPVSFSGVFLVPETAVAAFELLHSVLKCCLPKVDVLLPARLLFPLPSSNSAIAEFALLFHF